MYELQACVFYWKRGDTIVIALLYVDDIILTGNNRDKIIETKRRLSNEFKMKHLGEPKKFLGIEIERDLNMCVMNLTQTKFIDSMLKRFGLLNCRPCSTPMQTNQAERKSERKSKRVPKIESILNLSTKYCPTVKL